MILHWHVLHQSASTWHDFALTCPSSICEHVAWFCTDMILQLTMNGWRVIHQRKAEHRTCEEHSMNMFFKPQHPKIPNCARHKTDNLNLSDGSCTVHAWESWETTRSSIRHARVKFEDGSATAPLPSSPIGRPAMLRQLLTSSWPQTSENCLPTLISC